MARRLDATAPDFAGAFDALLNAKREEEEDVALAVRGIIADVRKRGDDALIELTNKFDKAGVTAATLRLTREEIGAAEAQCGQAALDALGVAAKRI
jgi:histidinol dehydrogenase